MITRARLAACAVLACAAMLVAACGSSSPSTASPAATTSPSVSHAPASSSASASPSAGPTDPAGVAGTWSGYGPCPDLEVKLGLVQHDPTVTYQVIDFTNRSSVRCIIGGYPGVSLAAGTPAVPIGLPAAHTAFRVPAKPIALAPGGVANALLELTDAHRYAQGSCAPVQAKYLIVYRPNLASPVKLAYPAMACSKPVRLLQVSAVSFGTGG